MCGKKTGTRRYMVEGTVMALCIACGKYGTPLDAPAAPGTAAAVHQGLERRAARAAPRSIFAGDEKTLVEDFGARIHKAREARGLSHEQLGNKVSARVPELKQIESGKLRPSDDLTKRLEKELGIVLQEAIQAAPTVGAPAAKKASGPLTIGDLLRDALEKKK